MTIKLKNGGSMDIEKKEIKETIIRKGDFIIKLESGLGLVVDEEEVKKIDKDVDKG